MKPNIIFVLADDLGYGELGCFGQKLIPTPHLDKMAAEGMKLTQFYAGAPVCAPSRSVLMTGLHTGHTRVRGNAGPNNPAAQMIRKSDPTVTEALKSVGYVTALIGKWGLANEGEEGVPTNKGFDYFYGYLNQAHAHNPYPPFLLRGEKRVALRNTKHPECPEAQWKNGTGWAGEKRDFAPDLMADEALKWVERNHKKPFFLYWSLITPHANNEGTRGTGNGQEVPELGAFGSKPWPEPDKAHAATIARLDADMGRLFALLKRLKIDNNTLVIFTSDNGHHKEGANDPELFDANGPLRGLKRDLYEGGIRVPTVVRWPGEIVQGTTSEHVGYFADIFPTLTEITGAAPPPRTDGLSLLPTLLGKAGMQKQHTTLYWEFHEGGFSQAVIIDQRWKAIRKKRLDAPIELYDLQSDLGEEKNIAAGLSDLVNRAAGLFKSERTDLAEWPIVASSSASAMSSVTAPPVALKIPPFYKKFISANGYPIVASERVSDYALKEAAYLVNLLLARRPDVRDAMIASGSRMCILAYNEFTTDQPEFTWLTPKDYWDRRARGLGGSETDPFCSCGEENLLGYPGDPYASENILIHEFAHNIHLRGMVRVDKTFDKCVKASYDRAMAAGLWKSKYAATNHHEYFAEGVQSWFDNNREPDHDHNHVNTRVELIEYDPGLASLCREVFGETELKYTKPATRLTGHLAGYDPIKSPKFVWREPK
ncbi:sulfatase-like hydrolase/transferase [Armatimonas sp.]|uniref:sulfatase-like hydrolase/transferase n=1 Tax=Armatimonas sp. TaxID=1872638 RepID=UPI003750893F